MKYRKRNAGNVFPRESRARARTRETNFREQ